MIYVFTPTNTQLVHRLTEVNSMNNFPAQNSRGQPDTGDGHVIHLLILSTANGFKLKGNKEEVFSEFIARAYPA